MLLDSFQNLFHLFIALLQFDLSEIESRLKVFKRILMHIELLL